MLKALTTAALALAVAAPASALAGSVFLNGTKVDGLTSTKIDKCASVEFDAKGNVHLTCPGYSVKVEGGTAPAPVSDDAAAKLTKRYFLVTEQAVLGVADYDIELYINAKFIRRLRNEEEQIVSEVTKYLVPGKNQVTLIGKKKQNQSRRSFSPEHFYRVIIGEGNSAGDRVMIDNPVVTFQRTAAETQDVSEEFTLVTR